MASEDKVNAMPPVCCVDFPMQAARTRAAGFEYLADYSIDNRTLDTDYTIYLGELCPTDRYRLYYLSEKLSPSCRGISVMLCRHARAEPQKATGKCCCASLAAWSPPLRLRGWPAALEASSPLRLARAHSPTTLA